MPTWRWAAHALRPSEPTRTATTKAATSWRVNLQQQACAAPHRSCARRAWRGPDQARQAANRKHMAGAPGPARAHLHGPASDAVQSAQSGSGQRAAKRVVQRQRARQRVVDPPRATPGPQVAAWQRHGRHWHRHTRSLVGRVTSPSLLCTKARHPAVVPHGGSVIDFCPVKNSFPVRAYTARVMDRQPRKARTPLRFGATRTRTRPHCPPGRHPGVLPASPAACCWCHADQAPRQQAPGGGAGACPFTCPPLRRAALACCLVG